MLGRSWLRATLIAIVMLGTAIVLGGGSALAHAVPESGNPPINGSVETAPPELEVIFGQEVGEGTTVDVIGPDGTSVNAAPAEIDLNDPDRKRVTVLLYGNLPAGTYTVNWTSVSEEDGDTETGSYTFTVTVGGSAASVASPSASPVASPDASPVAGVTGGQAASSKEQMNAIAEAAQEAATQQANAQDNFDAGAYGLSVLAGLGAAVVIYLFWRAVRPKPGERLA